MQIALDIGGRLWYNYIYENERDIRKSMICSVRQIQWDHDCNKTVFVTCQCEVCHCETDLEIVNADSFTLQPRAEAMFAEFHNEEKCYEQYRIRNTIQ